MNICYLDKVIISFVKFEITGQQIEIAGTYAHSKNNRFDFSISLFGPFKRVMLDLQPGLEINAIAVDDISERHWESIRYFVGDPGQERAFFYAMDVQIRT